MNEKQELVVFTDFLATGDMLKAEAEKISINSMDDVEAAQSILKRCQEAEKAVESARTTAVGPMNEAVKKVNATAKEVLIPVEQAKVEIKGKILSYQAEQEKIKAAAERKVQEQISIVKETWSKGTLDNMKTDPDISDPRVLGVIDLQYLAIDQKEREAEEQKRREAEEKELEERKKKMSEDEAKIAEAQQENERKKRELEEEQRKIDEQKKIEAAQKDAEIETSIATTAAPTKIKGMRTRWKYEVVDADQLPRTYLCADEKKIAAAIKDGTRSIPGVNIWEEKDIQ